MGSSSVFSTPGFSPSSSHPQYWCLRKEDNITGQNSHCPFLCCRPQDNRMIFCPMDIRLGHVTPFRARDMQVEVTLPSISFHVFPPHAFSPSSRSPISPTCCPQTLAWTLSRPLLWLHAPLLLTGSQSTYQELQSHLHRLRSLCPDPPGCMHLSAAHTARGSPRFAGLGIELGWWTA